MARNLIDISVPLDNDIPSDPPGFTPQINYINHQQSVPQLTNFFSGLQKEDLPDGEAWAIEQINLTTHNGTHLDAPYHFHSTMNNGQRAITIDEVPLEWCFSPAIKLDFRHFEDGYIVNPQDVEQELERINHKLQPLDIVLINTSAGTRYGKDTYLASGCGMGREQRCFYSSRASA